MAKNKKNKSYKQKLDDIKQTGAGTPKGIQYNALKGMSYTPSVKDINKRDRKQAKKDLKQDF